MELTDTQLLMEVILEDILQEATVDIQLEAIALEDKPLLIRVQLEAKEDIPLEVKEDIPLEVKDIQQVIRMVQIRLPAPQCNFTAAAQTSSAARSVRT